MKRRALLAAERREQKLRANASNFRDCHRTPEAETDERYQRISGLWYNAWTALTQLGGPWFPALADGVQS